MGKNIVSQKIGLWLKALTVSNPIAVEDIPNEIRSRSLHMEGIANARQLGGYVMADGRKIKDNKLLRTGNLHYATDKDVKRLAEEYKVKMIIDLRSEGEHSAIPDRKVEGAEEIWVNLMEDSMAQLSGHMAKNTQLMQMLAENKDPNMLTLLFCQEPVFQKSINEMYLSMLINDTSKKGFTRIFQEILQLEGEAVLWHCAQGKDRCGMMSVLLLGALGSGFHQILDDFEISNQYYRNILDQSLQQAEENNCNELTKNTICGIVGVNRSAMKKATDFMKNNYGSISNYIREELGVTIKELEMLRNMYLY